MSEHNYDVDVIVSGGGEIAFLSPLPSGMLRAPVQRERFISDASITNADLHSVRVTAAFGLSRWQSMLTGEPVTAAFDSHSARYARLAALWETIEQFARMPSGWAGEGAIPPTREMISHIGRLLIGLPKGIDLPQTTASIDGEIGLTWFKGDDRLDVIVSPDGYLSWASKVRDEFLDGDVLVLFPNDFSLLYKALADFYE